MKDSLRLISEHAQLHYKSLSLDIKQLTGLGGEIPQIAGLGSSATSREYAIKDLAEANEFLENDELRLHLYEICEVLISIESSDAEQVMGYPDNLKLHSCMTLFQVASPDCEYFSAVLGKYYGGELDEVTLNILG